VRYQGVSAILAAIICCLCSPILTAQETRPLTVWVDPVRLNVCGQKTFQTAIRAASFRATDTTIGFRSNDNVYSVTLYVTWDPSTIALDDLVIQSGTMSERVDVSPFIVDEESTLQIVIADRQAPYDVVRGALPLVYINGRVIAPDTVAWPNGWIQVTSVVLTSDTRFDPISYRPGYVRVERDTSQAYTGAIRVSNGSFDTLEFDTLTVSLENVRQRRVREVSFSIAADTSLFEFVDTLQTGTLTAQPLWTTVELVRRADTIRGRFVAASDLSQEGPLLKFLIRRTTDSAFTATASVVAAGINENSCLGRFYGFGAPVTASAIVRDTTTTSAPVLEELNDDIRLIPSRDGRSVFVRSGAIINGIDVYDVLGRRIAAQTTQTGAGHDLRLELETDSAGPYYVQLRIGNERISKQFIFIK
jgi:hypothetical protein